MSTGWSSDLFHLPRPSRASAQWLAGRQAVLKLTAAGPFSTCTRFPIKPLLAPNQVLVHYVQDSCQQLSEGKPCTPDLKIFSPTFLPRTTPSRRRPKTVPTP